MDALETIDYKGYKILIHADEYPQNPRTEWDHFGSMACWYGRYLLGDMGTDKKNGNNYSSPDEFTAAVDDGAFGRGAIVLPLFLYDHSGITISCGAFSCPWDSGQVGWTYASRADILKEFGTGKKNRITKKMRAAAEKLLRAEVETYDYYLTGQVYGYTIEWDESDNPDGAPCDDSCFGFLGEMKYCIDEAKSAVDFHVKSTADKRAAERAADEEAPRWMAL